MGTLSLTCLGTADGWPCADRAHAAFLYQFGSATLLVDCGEPAGRAYKASGLDYDRLDGIFLSHLHFDHIGGLFMLVQGLWLEGRTRPMPIHLPAEGIEPIRKMLETAYLFPDLLPFPLRFTGLSPDSPVTANGVRVTAFPTTHLDRLRRRFQARHPRPFAAFCFLLEGHGLRVAHSADLGCVEDLAPLLAQPVDLLVCELAHFELEDLTRFLCQRSVGRVVFVHLSRTLREDDASTRARLAAGLGQIPFVIARDGERMTLNASGAE